MSLASPKPRPTRYSIPGEAVRTARPGAAATYHGKETGISRAAPLPTTPPTAETSAHVSPLLLPPASSRQGARLPRRPRSSHAPARVHPPPAAQLPSPPTCLPPASPPPAATPLPRPPAAAGAAGRCSPPPSGSARAAAVGYGRGGGGAGRTGVPRRRSPTVGASRCWGSVEYHPFQRPQELVSYCRSRDIVFEGYCPLAKGEVLTHPSIIQLAKKYGRTPAQICIRWNIQNGIVTIPKSTKAERIEENCKVFDFTIAEDDVEILNGMHDGRHVSWDSSLIVRMKEMVILLLPTLPMLLVFDFSLREEDMEFLNTMNINRKLIHLTYPLCKG
uniref:NADP-dependent oxidoreductase domain-containing protein n=1 Tax=Aquila chrysaetos chrysaetos TaxID=223781 RepID=A0A663EP64_AQUCH